MKFKINFCYFLHTSYIWNEVAAFYMSKLGKIIIFENNWIILELVLFSGQTKIFGEFSQAEVLHMKTEIQYFLYFFQLYC